KWIACPDMIISSNATSLTENNRRRAFKSADLKHTASGSRISAEQRQKIYLAVLDRLLDVNQRFTNVANQFSKLVGQQFSIHSHRFLPQRTQRSQSFPQIN